MDQNEILKHLTPVIYQRFKTAVELGKWPDGSKLSAKQLETCLEAIVVYEQKYIEETQRTGYVPPKKTPCADKDDEDTLKWK
ncbi:hypothetical protein SAMN02745866_02594 [Alteromonadaceae bacterium Bs31]|nr:hypothetical protein SAMN02745866_02594 [Alteromonadaceae bacterium Bs31]